MSAAPLSAVFFGTSDFASEILEALAPKMKISRVVTQPDRRAGRGKRLTPPPVKETAMRLSLCLAQPERLRDKDFVQGLAGLGPDVIVTAAYGRILGPELLVIPRKGCLNVHASLLPRYRGAAPVARCLMNGDASTGVTIMQMDEGMDTGPILRQETLAIGDNETGQDLSKRLSSLGARLILETLERIDALVPAPQAHDLATYAPKLTKSEGLIRWDRPVRDVHNLIRALSPKPGAYAFLKGERVILLRSEPAGAYAPGAPGEILPMGKGELVVACRDGALSILDIQPASRSAMRPDQFLAGRRIVPGDRMNEA